METPKRQYVAFICPNLEYATVVWDPHLSIDIPRLESSALCMQGLYQKMG